eukprot:jgi/Ulvmu1/8796/UM048_0051.1
MMSSVPLNGTSSAPSHFEFQHLGTVLQHPLEAGSGMAANGPAKRANANGTFPGRSHQDPAVIWSRFQVDSERCRSRFAKLAKLPEWGGGPWQELYAEAFQDYNKLWNTQQRHRIPLTQAGLTRWAIGEIASKIGQLYYNYYARKSDTAALVEAAAFYDAIRTRQYFEGHEESVPLLLQRLRYHARCALVCLLLQDLDTASLIASSMQALALQLSSAVCSRGNSPALTEWAAVAGEAWACIDAETLVLKKSPLAAPPPVVPRRLSLTHEADACMAVVSHAVIITSRPHQLKIGALTLEALRLSQVLEWEAPPRNGKSAAACCPRSPRKLIFHQAAASRVHCALASTIDSMAPNKALLIYLSADSWPFRPPASPSPPHPSTPPASPQQPPTAALAWTPAAVTLADTSIMLLAPVLHRHPAGMGAAGSADRTGASGAATGGVDAPLNGDGLTGLSASNSGALMGTAGGDTQESAAHTALAQILPSVQAGPEQWPKRGATSVPPSRHSSSQALAGADGGRDDVAEAAAAAAGAELQGMELHDGAPARRLSRMSSGAGDDMADGSGRRLNGGAGGGSDLLRGQLGVRQPERDATASSEGADAAAHPPPSAEHVFCPADLVPATRRLLLLVVDSDRAAAFARLQELALGQQPLLLLRPEKLPERVRRAATTESMFSLFLTDPVLALVRMFGLHATPELIEALQSSVYRTLGNAHTAVAAELPPPGAGFAGTVDTADAWGATARSPWSQILQDVFAKRLVLRFALCRAVFARIARRPGAAKDESKAGSFGDIAPECPAGGATGSHSRLLPRALPELPEPLGAFAEQLSDDVNLLLRGVCNVDL